MEARVNIGRSERGRENFASTSSRAMSKLRWKRGRIRNAIRLLSEMLPSQSPVMDALVACVRLDGGHLVNVKHNEHAVGEANMIYAICLTTGRFCDAHLLM